MAQPADSQHRVNEAISDHSVTECGCQMTLAARVIFTNFLSHGIMSN